MPEQHTPWPAGAPSWADLSVTDIDRSEEFYTTVFGWEYTGGEAEFGGYRNATLGGKIVAGIAPPMEGQPEAPHFWTTYLAVHDSTAAQEQIERAGGGTVLPPMPVGPFGTMALFTDPTGALFGTWQPDSHQGFEVFGDPGTVCWNEAMVGDMATGQEFYTTVFGWTYQDMSAEGMEYAIFTTPGDEKGMTGGIGRVDEGQPPYWSVVFGVDGTDEAVQRVREAGGQVMVEPFDFEYGRLAVVTGPDGEAFGLLTAPEGAPQG